MKTTKMNFCIVEEVEKHPAWCGNLNPEEISHLLVEKQPFTYLLSGQGPQDYYLSYITKTKKIKQSHFSKISTKKTDAKKQCYRNGGDINFSSIDNLIRYKMKGKGSSIKHSN